MKSSSTGSLAAGKGHHSFLCIPVAPLCVSICLSLPPSLSPSLWNWGRAVSVISHNWSNMGGKERWETAVELWPQLGLQCTGGNTPGGTGGFGGERWCRRRVVRKKGRSETLHNNINRKRWNSILTYIHSVCLLEKIILRQIYLSLPFTVCLGNDAWADWCKQRRDGTGCLFTLFHIAPCWKLLFVPENVTSLISLHHYTLVRRGARAM